VRITTILLRQLTGSLEAIHMARLRLVFAATAALLRGGKISLTAIGRAIAISTSQKHGIKRVDRLLGNERLWGERRLFFQAIARRLIPSRSQPVILVDWTDLTKTIWTLTAALSVQGRAVVIYSESHPISRYLKQSVNRRFLRRLRDILPADCVPIIVTDAGFRSPWMKEVVKLGWNYVCRIRGLNRLREVGKVGWRPLLSFFPSVLRRAKDFGLFELGLRARYVTRIIGFRKRGNWTYRGAGWSEKWGKQGKGRTLKQLRAAKEPWILATSLKLSAKKIVALYRSRMQIEETFRDTKCPRFGLSMAEARTTNPRRGDILMLLASLAHFTTILAGLVAEASNLAPRFQANTLRSRRVLSLSRLGRLVLASDDASCIDPTAIVAAWDALRARLFPPSELV
jgi:hypothetical protein